MANSAHYRYVHYIATRILTADELMTQQYIDRLQDATGTPLAYGLSAMYRSGALLNVTVGVNGNSLTFQPTDTTKPMLVFCRGIWEPFTSTPIDMTNSNTLYLNYTIVSQPQSDGNAEMAELMLSLDPINKAGSPDPGQNELEKNANAIPVLTVATVNGVLVPTILDNVIPQAYATKGNGGLVKLSTPTGNQVAVADDDPRNSDERIPQDNSVNTPKVPVVSTNGTNDDGTPKVTPDNTGGIDSDKLVYAPGTKTVEKAITSLTNAIGGLVGGLSGHIGRPLGPGVHPFPTYDQVGAAPASHVGAPLTSAHDPTYTSNRRGFVVNRQAIAYPIDGDFAFLLQDDSGGPITGILHNGDIQTKGSGYDPGSYTKLSAAYRALLGHVSQVSHCNPHGLTLGDLGGAALTYVDAQDQQILAGAKNYTDSKVPTISTRGWSFNTTVSQYAGIAGTWYVIRFAPPAGGGNSIEIAFGSGYGGGGHYSSNGSNGTDIFQVLLPPDQNGHPVSWPSSSATAAIQSIPGMADHNDCEMSVAGMQITLSGRNNGVWSFGFMWNGFAMRMGV